MGFLAGYPGHLVKRDAPLLAIAVLAFLNGDLASPAYDFLSYFLYNYMRGSMVFKYLNAATMEAATMGLLSLMTVMIAGIPAAIYERLRGLKQSSAVSIYLWLAVTLLLTYPTLRALLADD